MTQTSHPEDSTDPTSPGNNNDDELEASLQRLEREVKSAKDFLSTFDSHDEEPPAKQP
jgi:hypothetical protein